MRILFDTNAVLDVLLDRKPFSTTAVQLLARVEHGQLAGCLGATTVTTLFYTLCRHKLNFLNALALTLSRRERGL
jgi:predicted nucleic acid-binding protein